MEKNTIVLNRETDQYQLLLHLGNTNKKGHSKYYLKEEKMYLPLQVTTKRLNIEENRIELCYYLSINGEKIGEFRFKLEYEVIA